MALKETTDVSQGKSFYIPRPNAFLDASSREFFESYTGLKGVALEDHLCKVRDRAFKIAPYPCLGSWTFLTYGLPQYPIYPNILSRIRDGGNALDLGCGLGQDLRRLFLDAGVTETSTAYACDLRKELWELGYDLFCDKGKFEATMVESDLKEDGGAAVWSVLKGKQGQNGEKAVFDVIVANSILHFFSWEEDVRILGKVTEDLTGVGSVFVGVQIGHVKGRARKMPNGIWRHDEESFNRLWELVNKEHKAKWKVSEYKTIPIPKAMDGYKKVTDEDSLIARFTVVREE